MKYIPVSYNSYNYRIYLTSIILTAIFLTFIAITFSVLRYELYNRLDICNPMHYYGKSCRNQIAKTLIQSPDFIKKRQEFYKNLDENIRPATNANEKKIENVDAKVNGLNGKIVRTEKGDTDVLSTIINILTSPLGNLDELVKTTGNIRSQFDEIPKIIDSIKEEIKTGIINPSANKLLAPLNKLYMSFKNSGDVLN